MPADDPSQPANGLVRSQQAWERANWAANTAGRYAARAERRRRRPDGVITAEYATPNIVHVGSKACQNHLAVSGTDAIAAKARSAPPSAPADESMIGRSAIRSSSRGRRIAAVIDPPPKQASASATSLSVPPQDAAHQDDPINDHDARSSRGPSVSEPPISVAGRPWGSLPPLSLPIGRRSPRLDHYR